MALSIAATSTVTQVPPEAAPVNSAASRTAAPSSAGTTAASSAQQQAALNQLLSKYKFSLAHDAPANALSSLRRQITAAAKATGQYVTLPRASVASNTAPVAPQQAQSGKVNVTA